MHFGEGVLLAVYSRRAMYWSEMIPSLGLLGAVGVSLTLGAHERDTQK